MIYTEYRRSRRHSHLGWWRMSFNPNEIVDFCSGTPSKYIYIYERIAICEPRPIVFRFAFVHTLGCVVCRCVAFELDHFVGPTIRLDNARPWHMRWVPRHPGRLGHLMCSQHRGSAKPLNRCVICLHLNIMKCMRLQKAIMHNNILQVYSIYAV